jgi:hypothetical protein
VVGNLGVIAVPIPIGAARQRATEVFRINVGIISTEQVRIVQSAR